MDQAVCNELADGDDRKVVLAGDATVGCVDDAVPGVFATPFDYAVEHVADRPGEMRRIADPNRGRCARFGGGSRLNTEVWEVLLWILAKGKQAGDRDRGLVGRDARSAEQFIVGVARKPTVARSDACDERADELLVEVGFAGCADDPI